MNKAIWSDYEKHLIREGISKLRRNKLKVMFNVLDRNFKVPLKKAKRKDIEKFIDKVHSDKVKKYNGEKFAGSTKSDIKKFFKQFYKWLKGNNEFYPKEVSWIKVKINKDDLPDEKPTITKDEVIVLANMFKKIELKLLVLLLFDSGFRISEMLSVKKKDITFEEYDAGEKCFWIFCNVSKTIKRKIPVPLFTEDLSAFFNSSYYQSLNSDDGVFNISYRYFQKSLVEHSKKAFNKRITPHCLRHSSATYYANNIVDGNFLMLCQRYGWSYNSKEPHTYIRRSGAYQKPSAKKVFSNDTYKLKKEMEDMKERLEAFERYAKEQRLKALIPRTKLQRKR